MTTNHRPTLESKRGKKRPIGDTIVHARGLTQQSLLKYRSDLTLYDISSEEAKHLNEEIKKVRIEKVEDTKLNENEDEQLTEINIDNNAKSDNAVPEGSDHTQSQDSSDFSESESDSDTEALVEELNKIKKEKEKQKEQEKQEKLNSNPLLSETPKTSWRSPAFRNKKKHKKEEQFTTNTVDSEYHRLFMKKFIR